MDVLQSAPTAGGSLDRVRTVLMLAAAVAPALTSHMADVTGFSVAFVVLAGMMTLAPGLPWALWVTR